MLELVRPHLKAIALGVVGAIVFLGSVTAAVYAEAPWGSSMDSVVTIEHFTTAEERPQVVDACKIECPVGSGVSVPGGYVVTAAHVVNDEWKVGNAIMVRDYQGHGRFMWLVAVDTVHDVAILREAANYAGPTSDLICDGNYKVGDEVTVRGDPLFLGITTTTGHIVRGERAVGMGDTETGSIWPDALLIDAVVTYGNSGGPTYDRFGRVIGIIVGFAFQGNQISDYKVVVPARDACTMIDKLVKTK